MTRISIFDRTPEPPREPEPLAAGRPIRALRKWVFLRIPADGERVSPGGIFLPETAKGRHNRAEVLWAGEGVGVERGERVCFDPYKIRTVFGHGQLSNAQGTPVALPGDTFVVHIDHIFFVEDPDDDEA